MSALNIFQTIRNTTHRIEPFHSQFLGDALNASRVGDRALFDGVWNLCAPNNWAPPRDAKVSNEFKLDGAQRIDILIEDNETGRVVGIEVKTSRASARAGQLEGYLQGLRNKGYADKNIAVAYLTPFNRMRAEEMIEEDSQFQADAGALSTVRVFESFRRAFKRSRHVSWLDVADIEWTGGGASWNQHQSYVRDQMAASRGLKVALTRNRSFEGFFGDEAVEAFRDALLPLSGVHSSENGATIDLEEFGGNEGELARALKFLITDDEFVVRSSRDDRFDATLRKPFLESSYSEFHEAVFELSEEFKHVWLQGKQNYGLRVAHKNHSGGVSLLTSQDVDRLIVGRRR